MVMAGLTSQHSSSKSKFLVCHVLPIVVLTSFLLLFTVVNQPSSVRHGTYHASSVSFPFEWEGQRPTHPAPPEVTKSLQTFRTLVIDNYLIWHSRVRFSYEAAIRAAAQTGAPFPQPPRLLVVRSDESRSHGLGDRFRAIVSAYFLAVLSNRLLLIDWRHPIPLSAAFIPSRAANFTFDALLLPPAPYDDAAIIAGNYFHRTNTQLIDVTTLFMDSVPRPNITRWFSPPPYRRDQNALLRRLAQLHPLPACVVLPHIFQTLFTPTPALRGAIRARLQAGERLARLVRPGMVYPAVHARLGLGLGELEKDAGRFNLTRLGTSLRGMARCFVDAALANSAAGSEVEVTAPSFIFLATDTPAFRPILAQEVRRRARDVDTVYLDAEVKHVRNLDGDAEDDISIFLDTFVEVLLLAKADRMVNLRSGFADLAAWMGGTCNQRVIDYKECADKYGIL